MIELQNPKLQPQSRGAPEVAYTSVHMRASHKLDASQVQRVMDRLSAIVGWPGCVALLFLVIMTWIGANLVSEEWGMSPVDPKPFIWLHIAMTTTALLLAALIFTTQRREDKLADHRAQLIMELAISNDQKISKIIELLEESRRDNPAIVDRVDGQAETMSSPCDPETVLEAIKDLLE